VCLIWGGVRCKGGEVVYKFMGEGNLEGGGGCCKASERDDPF